MPYADDPRRTELLDRIYERARWRLGDDDAEPVVAFIAQCYARVPVEDIEDRSADALFGAAFALWRLADSRIGATPMVRAYNPSLEEDGWNSPHTVVDVVTDDMPFLVDSVTAEINRHDIGVHLVVHPVLPVRRNESGELLSVQAADHPGDGVHAESFMHIEITREPEAALSDLAGSVHSVLADVRAAFEDWTEMRARLDEVSTVLQPTKPGDEGEELAETRAFLDWMRANNFTYLGYRAYEFPRADGGAEDAATPGGDEPPPRLARIVPGSGLGLLRDPATAIFDDLRADQPIPPAVASFLQRGESLAVTKSQRPSTVHRPVPMDTVVVKRPPGDGRPAGEWVFAGLFSAAVYNQSARDIPALRRKLARVLARVGFEPRSHDGRALANIVETFPRDELFQVDDDELLDVSLGILHLQHRQRVALFVRRDDFDRFMSCLVYVPRDRYTTQLRLAIQQILERAFDGRVSAHYLQVGDAPHARVHIIVQTTPGRIPVFELKQVEDEIVTATRSWADRLLEALLAAHGEEAARRLHRRYATAFPLGYRERFSSEQAVKDIDAIETAMADGGLGIVLYRPFAATGMQFRCKIYQADQPIILSHALPLLEHLGLRVVDEVPHGVRVRAAPQRTVMIHDFGLETRSGVSIEIGAIAERFREAFLAVWDGREESDGLNALVLSAGLSVGEVRVLRAYSRYLRQVGIPFTQAYLERVATKHPAIAGAIVGLFLALFDPDIGDGPDIRAAAARAEIAAALDAVPSAEDDRILRRFLNLVQATLRTNYFQIGADGRPKPYLSIKLDSRRIDDLPLPRPMVEIFVYSPRVEGIHLRGGMVARGGLRWSDRREDFRTEVLGLMKAQMVKNAVIVPVGAKGGFVVKRPPKPSDREASQAEGIACYRTLIRGLLDITDNRVGGGIVPPPRVVRRDGDDPYLVVAADKGTATFSDIANDISKEYGFWLGDAFASGGSQGYDHKAMGITARGAWESVKRHFREMGRDIQQESFTVVGVGDMSGDVFGNGMLLSAHIRLLAAFDHRHVFVDPDPDPAVSLEERRRLFALPRSSWNDYDAAKLSPGGAIFDRGAKAVLLSPQIRTRFGIGADRMTPAELISLLLRAEVDLLWFGGIGTFVKSADESHAAVGDRANDAVRVNAHDLRCRVIGEGANLGITQLGRIEYARAGGRINTDFIDNSAGVDCSDHEVNIKILLDAVVDAGDLTTKQRNDLLVRMTDEVGELVLRDNFLQTQALSLIEAEGFAGLDACARQTRLLERQGRLDRTVEFLPDEEALAERAAARQGFSRPELAVLFSCCKIGVNEDILASDLPDDPYLADDVIRYFPTPLRSRFGSEIARHRLKRELIATSITNSLVNRMGGVFVADIAEKTGMRTADTARAYIIARDVFGVRELWDAIEALDGGIPVRTQIELQRQVQRLIERGTLWFLRNGGSPPAISGCVEAFAAPVRALAEHLPDALPDTVRGLVLERAEAWQAESVPAALARRLASLLVLPSACDIVRIARSQQIEATDVGRVYFAVGEQLGFGWLRAQAERLSAPGYWQRLAVSAVIEELYTHQRDVTLRVLSTESVAGDSVFDVWSRSRRAAIDRSRTLLTELQAAKEIDLSMLTVASRQLRALTES